MLCCATTYYCGLCGKTNHKLHAKKEKKSQNSLEFQKISIQFGIFIWNIDITFGRSVVVVVFVVEVDAVVRVGVDDVGLYFWDVVVECDDDNETGRCVVYLMDVVELNVGFKCVTDVCKIWK